MKKYAVAIIIVLSVVFLALFNFTYNPIVRSLKPEGKAVLVEYRQENPLIPIKPLHKMSQKQVKKEMKAVGLTWQETKDLLPQQHLMIFTKKE